MELTRKRYRQILQAIFDRFVRSHLMESGKISQRLSLRQINQLAKQLDCNAHALSLTLEISCGRIGNVPIFKSLPKEEENKVMLAAARYHIKQIKVPLENYKREFGNVTTELNAQNPDLNLKIKELLKFTYPLYLQILEEIFE